MAENTNDENNDSQSGFLGLALAGLLCYGAYKFFISKSEGDNPSSIRQLSEYDVKDIVNNHFRSTSEDEIMMTCFTFMLPDVLGVKKEHYNEMLLSRLRGINNSIKSLVNSGYEASNPIIEDSHLNNLVYFLRNDCYNEIKETKFYYQLKGKLQSLIPGMRLLGKAQNANIDYKVLKAIRDGITEYFSALYVYGTPIEEALNRLKYKYIYVFNSSLD